MESAPPELQGMIHQTAGVYSSSRERVRITTRRFGGVAVEDSLKWIIISVGTLRTVDVFRDPYSVQRKPYTVQQNVQRLTAKIHLSCAKYGLRTCLSEKVQWRLLLVPMHRTLHTRQQTKDNPHKDLTEEMQSSNPLKSAFSC